MKSNDTLYATAQLLFWRALAKGLWPARWIEPALPPAERRAAPRGRLTLEVVSHCWNYSHLLVYQLSSLVINPPRDIAVTISVLYAEEDQPTKELLAYFAGINVPNVTWNWVRMDKEQLFRRGIGRNQAALQSQADWVWFTDCDLFWLPGCLDRLAAQLQGRRDVLLYPASESCTPLLPAEHPLLVQGRGPPRLLSVRPETLQEKQRQRATGPLQITHGDVCRAIGYCRSISLFQTPATRWTKAYEDGVFRWLLGSQGVSLALPGVARIRHEHKGRYGAGGLSGQLRGGVRRAQLQRRDPEALLLTKPRELR